MSAADSGFVYLHLFLARQPAVTVVAIKFHTREVNRRLFKIPMRAYARRSISAFSEITTRDITHKSRKLHLRFVEITRVFYAFFGGEFRGRETPRQKRSAGIAKSGGKKKTCFSRDGIRDLNHQIRSVRVVKNKNRRNA